ncbi:MAG: hypothetical protein ACI8TQ_003123 [Planctomycetota bacterium]|jgi:hypothetical protein
MCLSQLEAWAPGLTPDRLVFPMSISTAFIGFALFALPLSTPAPVLRSELEPSGGISSLANNETSDWVAEDEDHVCGLSSLRKLSNPAKVDYDDLWEATPEIIEMNDNNIDPDSAAGIRLQKLATDRIFDACEEVMKDESHCSIWKDISHKDERDITDLTKLVKEKFPV